MVMLADDELQNEQSSERVRTKPSPRRFLKLDDFPFDVKPLSITKLSSRWRSMSALSSCISSRLEMVRDENI